MADFLLADGFAAAAERFLWHARERTAVLSDLHLGAEAELSRRGILMPDVLSKAMRMAWGKVCERVGGVEKSQIVIAGDLFDVPTPDAKAVAMAREMFKAVPANCEIVIIPGNHDPEPAVLRQIFDSLRVTVTPWATVGGYTVIHGHQGQDAIGVGEGEWMGRGEEERQWVSRGLIVGHQHPAVVLANRVQSAKMICFAVCTLEAKAASGKKLGRRVPLIVLPTFSRAPLGSNLFSETWILDLPRPADADVRVLGVIEGKEPAVLEFGTLDLLRLPF